MNELKRERRRFGMSLRRLYRWYKIDRAIFLFGVIGLGWPIYLSIQRIYHDAISLPSVVTLSLALFFLGFPYRQWERDLASMRIDIHNLRIIHRNLIRRSTSQASPPLVHGSEPTLDR